MKARRILRWSLLGLAVLLSLALLLSVWLVRSDSGRDLLLTRATALLPPGASLQWQSAQGSLAGPLELRGVDYRHQGLRLRIERLRIDHGFWPLLSGRLQINTLLLEQVRLDLPPDRDPGSLPGWPEMLPGLDFPLTVEVGELQLRRMLVRRDGELLADISRADGGLRLSRGELALRKFSVFSDRGRLRAAGHYRPRDNFQTDLRASLVLRAIQGAAPAQLRLRVLGNLDDARVSLDGQAPAPLEARLRLRDGAATPRWELQARSSRLLLSQLGLAGQAEPYSFALALAGVGGEATLQGRVSRGDQAAEIKPSRLRLEDGVIALAPLAVDFGQGPVQLRGTARLAGAASEFDLRLVGDALRLAGADPTRPAVLANGELRLVGRWQAYRLTGSARLQRAEQSATVTLAGSGDSGQLRLAELQVLTPGGRLDGSGELRWSPQLQTQLDARLDGFDPGYFFPDYPGALDAGLSVTARQDDAGQWQGQADLEGLRGSLRARAVQGSAELRFAAGQGEGSANLRIGSSRIEASGSFGERLDLLARFSPLNLADLSPTAAGTVSGQVSVQGSPQAPSYRANLSGREFVWNDWTASTLEARGALPATGRGGEMRVSASGLRLAGQAFDSAALELSGSLADFRLSANVQGEPGDIRLQGSAAGEGDTWQGRLDALRIAPRLGNVWALRTPAAFRLVEGRLELERACLGTSTASARICAQVDGQQATVAGNDLPWTFALPWLGQRAEGLEPFGEVDLAGDFRRNPDDGLWSGEFELRSASGGLRLDPALAREIFAYSDMRLDVLLAPSQQLRASLRADLAEGGSLSGEATLAGLEAESPIQGELRLDARDLTWVELLSTDIAEPRGQLLGTLRLGGVRTEPSISGEARLVRFAADLPLLGVELRDGEFVLRDDPGGPARLSGAISSGEGQLRMEGTLDLADIRETLQLTLRGQNFIVADTTDLKATISPELTVQYRNDLLQVRGSVLVPSASVELEELDQSVSASPDVVVLDPRTPGGRDEALMADIDIMLRLGEDVQLRGFGLDGKLAGALRVVDRPGLPIAATGTLQVSGTYSAYRQELEIVRGRLGYVNSAIDNPTLDIQAEREIEDVTVGVRVRGRARAPETSITSSPSMSTTEALSWLVLGRPLEAASGTETQRINASALALNAGTNLLAERIGGRLGLDTAGIAGHRALGGSTLQLGKQLTPRLIVSYGLSLLGTGQVITLKYLITRGLNVSIESGDVETAASLNWRKEK